MKFITGRVPVIHLNTAPCVPTGSKFSNLFFLKQNVMNLAKMYIIRMTTDKIFSKIAHFNENVAVSACKS
jgi:sulfate adenylyltransferase subunit 1 (EFTu-like GTPase family)